jgi:hypothetical protein
MAIDEAEPYHVVEHPPQAWQNNLHNGTEVRSTYTNFTVHLTNFTVHLTNFTAYPCNDATYFASLLLSRLIGHARHPRHVMRFQAYIAVNTSCLLSLV